MVICDETRIDVLLLRRKLASSRTEAQRLVTSGLVTVNGQLVTKTNKKFSEGSSIGVSRPLGDAYVSRGGAKLAAALAAFKIDPTDLECLDIGISTGGFTDCLIQKGAATVTGIDVGHGQLHPSLASDPRVQLREGVNARNLKPQSFPNKFSLITVDVSFISANYILPVLPGLLKDTGNIVFLIKPQFEVGIGNLGKNGIVVDACLREEARNNVHLAAKTAGLAVVNSVESPIFGGDGNIEYLSNFRHAADATEA